MKALIAHPNHAISGELVDATRGYLDASLSLKTRKLYSTAWSQFTSWCRATGLPSHPACAETVALYAVHRAELGRKVPTINIDLAAIKLAHETAGLDDPTRTRGVRSVMRGIRREVGTRPTRKAPLLVGDLRRAVRALPDSNRGTRDAALLVVGFASAMRRSEIVAIEVEHIDNTEDGIRLLIPRSKTDQEAEGRVVGLPWGSHPETCPVRTLRRWMAVARIDHGPVFLTVDRADSVGRVAMSTRAVARAAKRAARSIGLDPSRFSGHSLRAGFATSAAAAGASERSIAKQTGHRSLEVLRTYIRDADLFRENAAAMVGL